MANIAIVTSTSFGANNAACFNAGLTSSLGSQSQPAITTFPSNGNYDISTLQRLVRAAVENNPRPDLIVTAGGLVAAMAAAAELTQATDPKFVFLSGDTLPGAKPAALAGGVNMDNPSEDKIRKEKLTNSPFSVPPGNIYLVVNSNAAMSGKDANNWPPAKVARFFAVGGNPPTNSNNTSTGNHFIAEFQALAQRRPVPRGLVISADPYFRLWRTALTIALADQLPAAVCYPFQDFIDAINAQPTKPNIANSIALDLPPLNNPANPHDAITAYFQLGKQAGRFIAGTADVQIVTWDATNSRWSLPAGFVVQPAKSQ